VATQLPGLNTRGELRAILSSSFGVVPYLVNADNAFLPMLLKKKKKKKKKTRDLRPSPKPESDK